MQRLFLLCEPATFENVAAALIERGHGFAHAVSCIVMPVRLLDLNCGIGVRARQVSRRCKRSLVIGIG